MRALKLAQEVRGLADSLRAAEKSGDPLLGLCAGSVSQMMFGDHVWNKVKVAETVFKGYAKLMHSGSTMKKATADHSLLIFLMEYVRAVSGSSHIKDICELLNATWQAAGLKPDIWTDDMIDSKMRAFKHCPISRVSMQILVEVAVLAARSKPIDYLFGA
jgi:hypothetical protein